MPLSKKFPQEISIRSRSPTIPSSSSSFARRNGAPEAPLVVEGQLYALTITDLSHRAGLGPGPSHRLLAVDRRDASVARTVDRERRVGRNRRTDAHHVGIRSCQHRLVALVDVLVRNVEFGGEPCSVLGNDVRTADERTVLALGVGVGVQVAVRMCPTADIYLAARSDADDSDSIGHTSASVGVAFTLRVVLFRIVPAEPSPSRSRPRSVVTFGRAFRPLSAGDREASGSRGRGTRRLPKS